MKKGRPSIPDKPEIQNAICDMVAASSKSVRSVLNEISKNMDGVSCTSTAMDSIAGAIPAAECGISRQRHNYNLPWKACGSFHREGV